MDMLSMGNTFAHRTLEDYVRESGGRIIVSDELEWGSPVGDEIW